MAWYEVERRCGHRESVQITGTNVRGERERRAAWLAKQPCGDCFRAEGARSRAEEAVRAAADNSAAGLPVLSGTDRQIAAAEAIRAGAVRELDELRAQMGASLGGDPDRIARADRACAALDTVTHAHTDARWWLDADSSAAWLLRTEAAALIKTTEETSR